jgi:N-acyl homoserine lactone hydrolase
LGLKTADISKLILTHSDIDHVGNVAEFCHAELVLGMAERALERPRYFAQRQPLDWPEFRSLRLVETDTELCPGLTLLCTPGHSPGHLSLLLELPKTGAVLLTADAISRPSELEEGFSGAWHEELAASSAKRLMSIAREKNAFIIYGHDPVQWHRLRKAPAYYE